jgi:hypothetical protein
MMAVAMVSFFAGTIFTAHLGLSSTLGGSLCDTSSSGGGNELISQHHRLDAKVEELAQKRLRGKYTVVVILILFWDIYKMNP